MLNNKNNKVMLIMLAMLNNKNNNNNIFMLAMLEILNNNNNITNNNNKYNIPNIQYWRGLTVTFRFCTIFNRDNSTEFCG